MDSIYDEFKDDIYMDRKRLLRHYRLIGRGSSRAVFAVSKNYVLKVPTSEKGIYQCRVEYDIFTNSDEYFKKYLCPIVLFENDRLLMKRAVPLKNMMYPVRLSIFNLLPREERNEFKHDLKLLAKTYDLLYNDIMNISSWGIYKGEYVLVDYGCTNRIYDEFY